VEDGDDLMGDEALAARCRALKLVLSDVDGVLTDGTVLMLPGGGEAKAFHVRDGLGVVLAHRAGLRTGVLSGRSSETVDRRASELGMAVVRQGVRDKRVELDGILDQEGLEAREVAYIGDDVNDLPVLGEVGLSAAPADAPLEVRLQAFMVTDAPGGRGCLREFVEAILRARGDWERVAADVGSTAGTP
jgi:3-deoxy-D-manno-octulosonate 8-phosphate phosphatase (KDO 8-P phosphatase)